MAQYDGSIRINTKINTDGIKQGYSSIKNSTDKFKSSVSQGMSILGSQITNVSGKIKNMGSRMRKEVTTTKRSVDGLSGSFRNLATAVASAFAVKRIAGIATSFTELGSDLEEVQNVVDVTFTTMSDKVNEFAKAAAKSAGLSETMAKRYVGTFGAMSKSFGFAEDAAFGMSTTLTQLAGDVASFYNITQDEAYTKLKSVFTGETETLKDLGVVMTENALNSYAMAKGIGKTVSKMTEQEKVALRYQFVLEKLSGASGDFVRTQDSWANQTRVLKLQLESLKATIGQGLINVLNPLLKILNTLLEKLKAVANAFKSFTESFFGKTSAGGAGSANKYVDTAGDITGSLEDVSDAAKDAEESLEGYLSPLDEINKYKTGKDDDLLSDLEDIDFGNLGDMNIGVTVTPEIDDSGLSDKFAQMAEKIKSVLNSLFNPLKEAWDREGKFVMDSWKYALDEVWGLIKDIGRDFLNVWQQEATISIFQDILHIIGDIGRVVGNLAHNFREAWNENEVGLHILENVRDIIGIIVEHIKNAADKTVEWSEKLDFYPLLDAFNRFLESLEPAMDAISGILEDFYTKVMLPLGTWVLEKGLPELLQVFIDFNNKVDWESLRANLAEFWEHLEPFAETVGEGLIIFIDRVSDALANFLNSQEFKDFLVMVENWMDSVTPKDVADALVGIAKALVALKLAVLGFSAISAIVGVFTTIKTFLGFIASFGGAVLKGAGMVASGVSGIVTSLGGILPTLSLVAAAVAGWEIGKWINEKLLGVDTPSFFEMMDGIKSSFTDGSWKEALKLWGDDIYNAFVTLGERQEEKFREIKDNISETWNNIKKLTSEKWGEIKEKLFSTWTSIKNAAVDKWNFIKSTIVGIIDTIKDKIDGFISKINDAIQSIKDFVKSSSEKVSGFFSGGGESSQSYYARSFSARSMSMLYSMHPAIEKLNNMPIPGYATGQVIPRTMQKHLAWLGDNPRETEVVSPLSTIKQALREEALSLGLGGFGGRIGDDRPIVIKQYLDGQQIMETVIRNGKIQQMSSGDNPFLLGTT